MPPMRGIVLLLMRRLLGLSTAPRRVAMMRASGVATSGHDECRDEQGRIRDPLSHQNVQPFAVAGIAGTRFPIDETYL